MAYKIGNHNIDHRKLKTKTSDAVNSTLTAAKASATSVFTSPFNQPVVRGYVYWNFDEDTKTLTFSMKTELSNKIGNKAQFTSYSETPWSAKCDEAEVEKVILLDKITLHYPQNWLPRRTYHYNYETSEDYYTEYEGIENLDLSQALNLDHMFENWTMIPKWIENLDVSAARSMSYMFYNSSFMYPERIDLSGWDTSHVTDMSYMFSCVDGAAIDIFTKTGNVTNFEGMFATCWAKVTGISDMDWNNGINFKSMFNGGSALTVLKLPNVPNGKYFDSMFIDQPGWEATEKTLDLTNWDTRNMETTDYMFCFFMGPNIYIGAGWNTDKVVSSEGMFENAMNLPNYNSEKCDVSVAHAGGDGVLSYPPYKVYWAVQEEGTVLRFSKFEIDGTAKGFFMSDTLKACPWADYKSNIRNVVFDFKVNFDEKNVGPWYVKNYFNHMPELVSFIPSNGFTLSSIDFTEAFSGDVKLKDIDLSCINLLKDPDYNPYQWQIPPANLSLKNMFYDCRALKKVIFKDIGAELGGIDASSMCRQSGIEEVEFGENYCLVNCESMFASSLAESIRFKYSAPVDELEALSGHIKFNYMFYNAKALTEVDLTEAEIFLDGQDWQYGHQAYHELKYLFAGCSALKEIYVMDADYWGNLLVHDYYDHMFEGCISLRNYDPEQDPNTDYHRCHPNCPRWDEDYYDYHYSGFIGYLYAVDNPPQDYNHWKVENGVLYISTSTLYNPETAFPKRTTFTADNLPPWHEYKDEVTKVVIEGLKLNQLDYVFYDMSKIATIEGLDTFRFTSNEYTAVTAISAFEGCSVLTGVDFGSGGNYHPFASIYKMFKNCENLKYFYHDTFTLSYDAEHRDTGLVQAFYNCKKLTAVNRYNPWDTWAFSGYRADYMFYGCESLTDLNVMLFDGFESTYCMFEGCSKLSYIGCYPEAWEISGDSTNMFRGCKSLPNFDPNYLNKEKAHRREGGYLSEL